MLFSLVLLLVACGEKDKTKSDSKPKIEARKLDGLKIAYYSNDSIKEYFEYYKREDAAVTKKQKLVLFFFLFCILLPKLIFFPFIILLGLLNLSYFWCFKIKFLLRIMI